MNVRTSKLATAKKVLASVEPTHGMIIAGAERLLQVSGVAAAAVQVVYGAMIEAKDAPEPPGKFWVKATPPNEEGR